jgi:hypothetical protein
MSHNNSLLPNSQSLNNLSETEQQQQQHNMHIPHLSYVEHNSLVRLNVGGKMFMTHRDTLLSSKIYTLKHQGYHQSYQAVGIIDDTASSTTSTVRDDASEDNDDENFFIKLLDESNKFAVKDSDGAYFIDRSYSLFEVILEFIRTGDLILPINETIDHVLQTILVQKVLREADFYMIDISSQLYNIVGDGIYVSEEPKGFKKCMFFFDKDPTFKPSSVFVNGIFRNEFCLDREVRIINGTLIMYNNRDQVEYIMYPTTASYNGQLSLRTNTHTGGSNLPAVIVVRDSKRFNSTFILREAVPPNKIALNFSKAYYDLSDYNHSIRLLPLDTHTLQIVETFKDDLVPQSVTATPSSVSATRTASILTPEELFREKYTFSRRRPLHGVFEEDDDEEPSTPRQPNTVQNHHNQNGSSGTGSTTSSPRDISKTSMKLIRTNFIAKSKKNVSIIIPLYSQNNYINLQ